MKLKDEYLEKLKAQLDVWSAEIDVLEAKARRAEAELRIKCEEQVESLKVKREEAKSRFAEIKGSAGEAWLELKKGGDEAWESLRRAFEEARKKFDQPAPQSSEETVTTDTPAAEEVNEENKTQEAV